MIKDIRNKFLGTLDKKVNNKGELKDAHTNYKNYLQPYYIKSNLINWDNRDVGYFPEDDSIFNAPCLLITGGITKEFRSVSAILYENALFKSSLTAIKSIDKAGVTQLNAISALLNSTFFAYFILNTGSSSGIEREETHDIEKWETPFVISDSLVLAVSNIETLYKKYHNSFPKDESLKIKAQKEECNAEKELLKLFDVSKQESSLIEYTTNITIPLLKGSTIEKNNVLKEIKYGSKFLEEYAEIFISHFSNRFNSDNLYFEVEILHSNKIILMKFKIIDKPSNSKKGIVWKNKGDKELLKNIASLSFENLSDNLFLQKDIKGFERDYFYIAKPNQYKSWHSALAQLDLSEFIDELHKNNKE